MRAAAAFALMIYVGVDIDVLFGLLFDAGAYFVGSAVSELPVEVIDNEPQNIEPCFRFKLDFGGYFDPCPFCPTPVITFEENFVDAQNPTNCSGWDGPDQHSKGSLPIFSIDDARRLVRHPFAAYDRDGNGHLLALDDTHTLQATRLFDSTPDDVSTVLSDAPAIRHPRIAYYDVNRAVAVWVESALDRATFTTTDNPRREQNQHLVWSHWDGRAWSPKAELTPALSAAGEAHPAIAPCFAGDVDCPAAGEVSLVWQRFSRDAGGLQKSVIMHAYFADGAWETPTSVAPTLARVLDLTPSVSYLGANPAVIWVRNTEPGSSTAIQANPDARQLWYRVIGAGSAASAGNVPTGVVAPSLLAKAPSSLYIAFTRADGDTGFLGTRQALHTSFATCTAGNCGFSWRRVSLPGSRSIYGEKPIIVDTGGEPSIVMRALHLGAGETNGASQPGDPLGTALISGDLVRLETSFQSTRAYMSPITNDGAMYFGHTATYNRKTGETIALGVPSVPPIPAPLRAVLKSVGYTGVAPASKQAAVTGGLQFNALEGGPDFAIEQLSSIGRPVGGESLQLFLAVANRGKGYLPASMGPARLEVRLDDPAGSGPPLLSLALPALAPAERFAEAPTITVPADISTNDAHTLYARIVTESAGTDTDGSNNEERLDFAGLAVPGPVRSELIPNVPFVQLTWPYTGDDRVVGFRIYVEDGDGTWWPLGSSLVNGFLDLTSQFGAPRRYAVASYSADGVESERSEPITAVPVLALGNRVFESGFEEVDEP